MSVNSVMAPGQHEQGIDAPGGKEDGFKVASKVTDEAEVVVARVQRLQIDLKYEFSAPKYFDFCKEETDIDIAAAEHWFDAAETYDPPRPWPTFRLVGSDGLGLSLRTQGDQGETLGSGMDACEVSPVAVVHTDEQAQGEVNMGSGAKPAGNLNVVDLEGKEQAAKLLRNPVISTTADAKAESYRQGLAGRPISDECELPASANESCGSTPMKRAYADGWKDHLHSAMKKISKSLMLRSVAY